MRKHISVFMLIVRSCVYWLVLIMLAMAAAEAVLVALVSNGGDILLHELIDGSGINYAYGLAVALATVCVLGACSFGSAKPRYTLARLSVSEKSVMLWHWLCGALVFLLLWLWQIILIYAIAIWHHGEADAGFVSHQSIYLANFRSEFFHSVLPLEDISRIFRNAVLAVCMGGVCATGAHKIRRGKKPFAPIMLVAVFAASFKAEHFELSYDAVMMTAFAIVLAISLAGVFTGDAEVDYEEASLEN